MIYVKRILTIFAFLSGLAVLLAGASYLFMPKNNTSASGTETVSANGIFGEKENTIDIIVIGDSESYSSITPMQIWKEKGYTAYVCGTGAQTLDESLAILKQAFQRQKPKLVIFETNAIYRKIPESGAALEKMSRYFSIFQTHDRWKTFYQNGGKASAASARKNDFKGYIYRKAVKGCKNRDYMKPVKRSAKIPDLNLRYVREIKDFCETNGAKLLFLSTPSPVNWNYKRHNGIAALAGELACEYVDLNLQNDELRIDWSKDTRDKGDHLNHSGARKVTHYLAGYLDRTKLLQDHRDDPAYKNWDKVLKRYEAATSDGADKNF